MTEYNPQNATSRRIIQANLKSGLERTMEITGTCIIHDGPNNYNQLYRAEGSTFRLEETCTYPVKAYKVTLGDNSAFRLKGRTSEEGPVFNENGMQIPVEIAGQDCLLSFRNISNLVY
jgi:hypothetical protein